MHIMKVVQQEVHQQIVVYIYLLALLCMSSLCESEVWYSLNLYGVHACTVLLAAAENNK